MTNQPEKDNFTAQESRPKNRGPLSDGPQRQRRPRNDRSQNRTSPTRPKPAQQPEQEPICVLKVELDGGENVQHIRVFEGQLPEEIVEDFGRKFNLSERAKFRLLDQINEQINA